MGECVRTICGISGGGMPWDVDMSLLWLSVTMCIKAVIKYLLEKGETMVLLAVFEADVWAMYVSMVVCVCVCVCVCSVVCVCVCASRQ